MCARDADNPAGNCHKGTSQKRKFVRRAKCIRPETRSAGGACRSTADKAGSENRGTIKNRNLNEESTPGMSRLDSYPISTIDSHDNEVCRTFM